MSVKSLVSTCCPPFLRPAFNRIESSPLGYRLAKGVFWSMAGAVISRGLMLAASVLVARMLSKTGYGELGMIRSTVGMFGVFAGFGLGLTATKHVAEFRRSDPDRAGRIIGISGMFAMVTGGLMALGLFIFAPWLAEHTINAPHLAGVLRIGALILFINALNGAQTGALAGFEAFRTIAYVNLFVGLISFPILVGGTYFGGLTGAVWALAINLCFNWLLNHVALRKEARQYKVPFTFRNCSLEHSVLWTFSLPLVLGNVLVAPSTWACNVFLIRHPGGYREMATLTAALTFQGVMLFGLLFLNGPLLAMLSNADLRRKGNLVKINFFSSAAVGLLAGVPLLCFPEILSIIFGTEYQDHSSRITLSLVVFYTCIVAFRHGFSRMLIANSRLWIGFLSTMVWAVILLSGAFYLVRYGAAGIAGAFCIAYALHTVLLFYICRDLLPKEFISKKIVLIGVIVSGLAISSFWEIPVIVRLFVATLVLVLIIWALVRINPIDSTNHPT